MSQVGDALFRCSRLLVCAMRLCMLLQRAGYCSAEYPSVRRLRKRETYGSAQSTRQGARSIRGGRPRPPHPWISSLHKLVNHVKPTIFSSSASVGLGWYNGRRGGRLRPPLRIAGTCARRSRFIFFALTERHVEQRFAPICILRASSAQNVPNHQTTASSTSRRGPNGL